MESCEVRTGGGIWEVAGCVLTEEGREEEEVEVEVEEEEEVLEDRCDDPGLCCCCAWAAAAAAATAAC